MMSIELVTIRRCFETDPFCQGRVANSKLDLLSEHQLYVFTVASKSDGNRGEFSEKVLAPVLHVAS